MLAGRVMVAFAGITPICGEAGALSRRVRHPRRFQRGEAAPLPGGSRPALAVAKVVCVAGIQAGASLAGFAETRLVKVDHRCRDHQVTSMQKGQCGEQPWTRPALARGASRPDIYI